LERKVEEEEEEVSLICLFHNKGGNYDKHHSEQLWALN
jgi:hypothetical protein